MDLYYEIGEIKRLLHELIEKVEAGTGNDKASKVYDLNELEEILHVSRRTIATWMSEGILPFSKIGHKIYITQNDVEEFLAKYHTKSIGE